MHKTLWLFHKDIFIKATMQESIENIQLLNVPSIRYNKRKYQPNGGWLYHRAKSIMIIKSKALMEILGYQPGFVPIKRAIFVPFDAKHPLASNNILC